MSDPRLRPTTGRRGPEAADSRAADLDDQAVQTTASILVRAFQTVQGRSLASGGQPTATPGQSILPNAPGSRGSTVSTGVPSSPTPVGSTTSGEALSGDSAPRVPGSRLSGLVEPLLGSGAPPDAEASAVGLGLGPSPAERSFGMAGFHPANPPNSSGRGPVGIVRPGNLAQRFSASLPQFGLDPIRPGTSGEGPNAGWAPLDSNRAQIADSGRGGLSSLDLTKTNELLQQLLDEVRRGRPITLPAGARAIRSER